MRPGSHALSAGQDTTARRSAVGAPAGIGYGGAGATMYAQAVAARTLPVTG
jgi:hypothetical protein